MPTALSFKLSLPPSSAPKFSVHAPRAPGPVCVLWHVGDKGSGYSVQTEAASLVTPWSKRSILLKFQWHEGEVWSHLVLFPSGNSSACVYLWSFPFCVKREG